MLRRYSMMSIVQRIMPIVWLLLCHWAHAIALTSTADKVNNAPPLWGPYRPNLYLGIRSKLPDSVLMGLMWSNADEESQLASRLRHTCEQNEGMTGYGWNWYDPRIGGEQTINDTGNKIDLSTTFLQRQGGTNAFNEDGWALRVNGRPRHGAQATQKNTVVFYMAVETFNSNVTCVQLPSEVDTSHSAAVGCRFDMPDSEDLAIDVLIPSPRPSYPSYKPKITVQNQTVDMDQVWNAGLIFKQLLEYTSVTAKPSQTELGVGGNMQFVRMDFHGEFQFDVILTQNSKANGQEISESSQHFAEKTVQSREQFDEHFQAVYLPKDPFSEPSYATFSRYLISNLMGGIGFFHGSSRVGADNGDGLTFLPTTDGASKEEGPLKLLSMVPSRSFFPRGFLWDEGFHLQVVLEWDLDLAIEILTSWLDLMDADGWIAREQILGSEARSKVPLEFQTQHRSYANPPTMFMVMSVICDKLFAHSTYHGRPSVHIGNKFSYANRTVLTQQTTYQLRNLLTKLRKSYKWFRRTQVGTLDLYQPKMNETAMNITEGYRWRGRTQRHILTSGLDDYPRAETPSVNELHLDAICWVSLMAQTLQKLSQLLEDQMSASQYQRHIEETARAINEIHWSDDDQAYCDVTITVEDQLLHVCHKGYVSLMPLLTNSITRDQGQGNERLGAIFDLIESPSHLWSPYGLRSLSTKDKYYGTDENYWRSPIWVNFNYLVLRSLGEIATGVPNHQSTRARGLYIKLRKNIVNTVFRSWKETGFAWEQYNPDTGKGQRTQHFTGWTALVANIMAMPDLSNHTTESGAGQPLLWVSPRLARYPDIYLNGVLMLASLCTIVGFILFKRRIIRVGRSCMTA